LRKTTDELDRFFTIALDLFCIASTGGYFLRLNPAWEHTLGYTLAELKQRQFFDFIHPEDLVSTREAMAALIAQKEVINFPNRYPCKDGSYRWFEWRATTLGGRIYATARDITERKKAEETIRASEKFSRTVLESSADCIKVTDPCGRIEFMNGPGLRLMEIDDCERVKGRLWIETWPDKARPLVRAAINEALKGSVGHFSALCPTEKGEPKWWDVLAAPVTGSDARILNLVSTAR